MTIWQRFRQHPMLYLWLPLVLWMGLIFFLSEQPDLPYQDTAWFGDLLSIGAHAFVFGILALLWARVLGNRRCTLLMSFLLTVLYALLDEFHQSFVPGRTADPFDLLSDGFGAAMGLWAWTWLQRRSAYSRQGCSDDSKHRPACSRRGRFDDAERDSAM